jgi:hypothetical protein
MARRNGLETLYFGKSTVLPTDWFATDNGGSARITINKNKSVLRMTTSLPADLQLCTRSTARSFRPKLTHAILGARPAGSLQLSQTAILPVGRTGFEPNPPITG